MLQALENVPNVGLGRMPSIVVFSGTLHDLLIVGRVFERSLVVASIENERTGILDENVVGLVL